MDPSSWFQTAALIGCIVFGVLGLVVGLVAFVLTILWLWHPIPVDTSIPQGIKDINQGIRDMSDTLSRIESKLDKKNDS